MIFLSHLYDLFQPKHYDVYLNINRQAKHFHGRSVITGHASQKDILINKKGMQISEVKANGKSVSFSED